MTPESATGRATAAAGTGRRAGLLPQAPRAAGTPPSEAATRVAAAALVLAVAALVLLPGGSVYFVKVLRVPQAVVLGFAVPAAALALLAALGLAHWSRGASAADPGT